MTDRGPGMSAPMSMLTTDKVKGAIFRRVVAAPDYSSTKGGEILANWSLPSVPVIMARGSGGVSLPTLEYSPSTTWAKTVYPAIDIAWCPFKEGEENASFLTATNSAPLQMWDVEDGALRASYCCCNAMGAQAHPHSILWSCNRTLIAAGYGGRDDEVHVRFYDVLREGDCVESFYRSPCSKGIVSALGDGPAPHHKSLLLAGFIRTGNVDVIDTRHCGAAAVLRGLKSGVAQVVPHPAVDYLVYAAGRLGDNRILCWDIRRSNDLLSTFERSVRTQQPALFGFVRRPTGGSQRVDLVSATHSGGVLVFDGRADGEPQTVQGELGPTAGLTVLGSEGTAVAVTVGGLHHAVRDRYEENASAPSCVEGFGLKRNHSQACEIAWGSESDGSDEGTHAVVGVAVFNV